MRAVRRILVAIKDPSARSLPAVDKAIQLARAFGARVELFHGIAEQVYTDFGIADQSLDENRHLLSRHPVNAIPELAKKIRSDLVVMGAISRTGLRRLLIGNTAERIVDDLTCDVLVVKPRNFVSTVKTARSPARLVSPPLPIPY
jgi:nucleotide-binding universal stress UspA family protein